EVMNKYGLIGKEADEIGELATKPLQEEFNTIAKSSGLKVNRGKVDEKALKYIDDLLKSPSKEDHKLAEQLLEEYDFAASKLGDDVIDIADLNSARQTFDGKVKNWKLDPMQAGKNRLLGKIFRESMHEAADEAGLAGTNGQTLKQMGLELRKLYDIEDLALLQGNLGKGNLPVGMQTLLSLGAGGAISGGPAGAVAMAGLTKALNSPKAMSAYAKLLAKTGRGMTKVGTMSLPSTPALQLAGATTSQL